MGDEDKDPRCVGRDEMNLCEYPIASLTDHPPKGIKTLVFEDRHGRLTVIGSDAYGLPTALDNDVIVGLIQLTKLRNDFTDPTVTFSRYELLNLLGWPDRGQYYRRLNDSLHRWVTVTLKYDGCCWDNKQPRPEDVVLGGPPRGGHFRVVAPVGGVGVGKAPSGPFMVTRGPAPLDDSPTLPVRGCTAAPGPHPARRC